MKFELLISLKYFLMPSLWQCILVKVGWECQGLKKGLEKFIPKVNIDNKEQKTNLAYCYGRDGDTVEGAGAEQLEKVNGKIC